MSIFRKKEEDVPEVRVNGENGEIIYPETEKPQSKQVKMPATKWA
jgi:hypothetical protein